MKTIILVIFAMIAHVAVAQGPAAGNGRAQLDALMQVVDHADDSKIVAAGNKFTAYLNAEDPSPADDLEPFAKNAVPDTVRAEVWCYAGESYYAMQELELALKYAKQSYDLLRRGHDWSRLGDCSSLLAAIYFRKSDYPNAIIYAKESNAVAVKLGDKADISSSLNSLAVIFLGARCPNDALGYALKAITYSEATGDSTRLAIQCGTTSEIYHSLKRDEDALRYARRAYEIETARNRPGKAAVRQSQMASALIGLGRLGEAKETLLKAVPQLEKDGNLLSLNICNNQLGEIELEQKNYSQAIAYFTRAQKFFAKVGNRYNESHSQMGLYQALKGSNPSAAMQHLERYSEIKDSLYRSEIEEQLVEFNAKYKNDELQHQNEMEKNKQVRTMLIALMVASILIAIIALLWTRYRYHRRHRALLRQQQIYKDQFFTNITHEFRTPLSIIQMASQSIIDSDGANVDELHKHGAVIQRQGNNLLTLVNQLLDIAKLRAGETSAPSWRHGDVVELLRVLVDGFGPVAQAKQVKLAFASSQEQVMMDLIPDYLQKIMVNLLGNAFKFSHPGQEVLVHCQVADGDQLRLTVSDEGDGMSPEQQAHIFEPFYQADTESHHIGTGIGLSLVHLCVQAMNGAIQLYSAPGMGTTFVLTFPLHNSKDAEEITAQDLGVQFKSLVMPASVDHEQPVAAESGDADDPIVLIVEDSNDVARYMAHQLRGNYRFHFATNGREGLEQAQALVPDLIITDVMMPEMDGFEFTSRVRAHELLCHIPVVMVTARSMPEDRVHGLQVGADAYLEKPFREDELRVRVTKLLEQRDVLRRKWGSLIEQQLDGAPAPVAAPAAEDAPDAPAQQPAGSDNGQPELQMGEKDRAFLDKFVELVKEQLDDCDLNYEQLAAGMCVTRVQLNRKIKAISGVTTQKYIHNIRIATAKRLLTDTDLYLDQVALRCGIDSTAYFCNVFKKATGMTPTQWRDLSAQ